MEQQVVVFGEVLFDCFPDGTEILGGAPFNVAWHLQALGLHPLLVSRIGQDRRGETVVRAMEEWGMDTACLQVDPLRPTGKVAIRLDRGEPTYTISPDDAWGHIHAPEHDLPAAALLYHGSLALWADDARTALAKLKDRLRKPVFVDVNLRPPWWERATVLSLLEDVSWLKLNEEEFSLLFAGRGTLRQRATDVVARLRLQALILTRGKHGATVFEQDGQQHEVSPATACRVVDAVGAGDAFSAVVLLGLVRGWAMQTTLQRAQEFASAIVGHRGATVADHTFYAPFVHRWSK